MVSRFKIPFSFLALVLAVLVAFPAAMVFAQDTGTPTAAPTIQSDKEDYPPGALVTLTGSGWQPGETVNINVNDDVGQTWNRNVNVTADANGNITDQFNLPDWFVATYYVTATGDSGSVARTTFTDAKVDVRANLSGGQKWDLTWSRYEGKKDAPATTCTNGLAEGPKTDELQGTGIKQHEADSNGSVKFSASDKTVHTSTDPHRVFDKWTLVDSATGAVIGTLPHTTEVITARGQQATVHTICVAGQNGSLRTYVANYKTPDTTAPAVSSIVRADASPTNAASVRWTVTFSESVTGVDAQDFSFAAGTGLSGQSITNVAVNTNTQNPNTTYTVTANTGTGNGSLGLNLVDNDTIVDGASNKLGGTGTGNGNFTGQVYEIQKSQGTSVSAVSGSGTFGGNATLTAKLASGTTDLANKQIQFKLNNQNVGSPQTTNASGVATLTDVSLSGINAGSYAGAVSASFAGDSGYDAASGSGALTVSKADQTITFGALANKPFGAPDFQVSATASSGLAVAFTSLTTSTCTVSGNTVHLVSAGDCTLRATQGGNGNYNAAAPADQSFAINKANQTITFAAPTGVTYGDAPFNAGATASSGLAVGYSSSTPGVCTIDSLSNEVRIVSAGICTVTASQTGNNNYNPAADVTRNITINAKELTGSFTAADKVYDGNASATIATRSVSGAVTGDDVGLTGGTATFADKNVGTAKTVTATGFTLSGAKASNYTLKAGPWTTTATVTAKPLTGSFTAADKVYDGTTDATIAASNLDGKIAGDVVTLAGGTASFADKNVGTGKTVSIDRADLSGADAGNYTLAQGPWTAKADITPKPLTGSFTAADKAYDGDNSATIATRSVDGAVSGDDVGLTGGTATFADKNVGTAKTVTGTGFSLSGSGAGNYTLKSSTLTTTASITAKQLTVTADNKSKVYGAANPTFTVSYRGFVNGDTAASLGGTLAFDTNATASSPVGSYDVTPKGLTSGNYNISFAKGTLTINKADLTVTAKDATKVYGANNPAFDVGYSGFVNGDTAASLGGTLAFDTPATASSPVGSYDVTPSGLTSGNYNISFVKGTLTVTKADLTMSADNKSKVYGAANPTFTGTLTGVQNNDGITASYGTTATQQSAVGTYDIVPTLNDPNNKLGNYNVTKNNGTLTVTKADLTVTADNKSKTYGDANPNFTVSYDGFKNGDAAGSLGGTLQFSTNANQGSPVGSYDVTPSGLTSNNYTITFAKGTLTVDKRAIEVTADNKSKTYGENDPALTYTVTGGNLVNGDAFTGSLTRQAGQDVGTYAINQGTLSAGGNYTLTFKSGTLTVTKADLTVTADNKSKTYSDANPTFTASYSGFKNGDTANSLGGTLAFGTQADQSSAVGAYDVTPSGLTSGNYTINFVKGTLTINKADLTVKADDKSKIVGAANPTLTGTLTGVKNNDGITASYGTTATQSSPVGTYPITPSPNDPNNKLGNYNVTKTNGTLTINYDWRGFLQPINDTAHMTGVAQSKFKLGQTIPVRFAIYDAAGTSVQQATNPTFTRSNNLGSCDATTTLEDPSTLSPDAATTYTFNGGQYHYNWSTKGLSAGEYRIFANLADGTKKYVDICLTK